LISFSLKFVSGAGGKEHGQDERDGRAEAEQAEP
jgi:hypothetical protein